MQLAFKQAELSYLLGEVPVGAVILDKQGNVIAKGHNRTIIDQDPTAHAEVVVLRKAALIMGNHRLPGFILYVTLEPCLMCIGAISQARLDRVIFGTFDSKGQSTFNSQFNLNKYLNHKVSMIGGILSEDCGKILHQFFHNLRYNNQ
ncbi:MAG: nucleoside deaminase [Bordetella sp.]|nr:MAG: nucleoside deaminase [Bordetella sp.]